MRKNSKYLVVFIIILVIGTVILINNFFADPFKERVNESLDLAIDWLINDFNDKGIFYYQYDLLTSRYSDVNNVIRQLLASKLLAELSQDNIELEKLHQKNLDFIFKYWYKEKDGIGYIYYNSKSKLGANAMAIRTLVYSPFFDNYKEKSEKLANSILSLQNEDGSFEPYFIEPDSGFNKQRLLYYYSGEAILSLIELYEKTKEEKYLKAAIKSQDYYLKEYVEDLDKNYYPAYVPWHTQSLNKLFKITKDKKYSEAIFILNDELLKIQNQDEKENNDFLGRFYNPEYPNYGTPHSASDAVYTEGLAYAYEIAELVDDKEHKEKYKKAIILGANNLINLQITSSDFYLKYLKEVFGAIRYKVNDNRTRIDTTTHTIDAFRKILSVI